MSYYGPDAPKTTPLQDIAVIEEQLDAFRRDGEGHRKWAEDAKVCQEFTDGKQWSDEDRCKLENEGRNALVLNKISRLVRWAQGRFRQNRLELRYLPGNDGSGLQETAEALTACVKQIEEANQAEWLDAQVFQDGIITGRAFTDLRLDFERNVLGEVKETLLDPFSVYLDAEADTYEPEGWGHVIVSRWMSLDDITLCYGQPANDILVSTTSQIPVTTGNLSEFGGDEVSPDRFFGLTSYLNGSMDDFSSPGLSGFGITDHINRKRKLIRVLDRQHYALKRVRWFVDLVTGQMKIIPDHWEPDRIQRIMQWSQMRGLPLDFGQGIRKVVRNTITAADKILFDDWSPYDTFTVVPYFPIFRRGHTKGLVSDLIDPQREINKRRSAILHIIMTTANSGWIYPENSLREEMKQALEEEGSRPGINVEFSGQVAPTRIQPAAPPSALRMLEEAAARDLPEISGINESALGEVDRVQSGRAIQARQQSANNGAEIYFANFSRYRELKGRKLKELVQGHYTEERVFRVRGPEGDQLVVLNRKDAAGRLVNDVTSGNYDVIVDEVPISASFMQGQLAEALELKEKGVPIPDDILVELSTMPRKQEIIQRMTEARLLAETLAQAQVLGATGGQPLPPVLASNPKVIQPPPQPRPSPEQAQPMQTPMPMPGVGR
jgi:hypothetical protein